ncbi:hypothetical protein [Qipengyuania sp. ASV99]|uniref:hypothetical protein n=1 Tax=Qipengyuania sp. ASV99 TaxID=3399681 RepID=UPI003A4C76C9
MKMRFLVLVFIICTSCENDEAVGTSLEIDDKTYSERLNVNHYEACADAERAYPDYELLPNRSAKAYLKYRHQGERIGAFLAYNEYYCALLKKNIQEGAERCVVFTPAYVGLDGSVEFCIDKDGMITDFL